MSRLLIVAGMLLSFGNWDARETVRPTEPPLKREMESDLEPLPTFFWVEATSDRGEPSLEPTPGHFSQCIVQKAA